MLVNLKINEVEMEWSDGRRGTRVEQKDVPRNAKLA